MSLSSITISGTLKKDPEKRFTPTNIPVTNLTLEVSFVPRGNVSQQEKGLSSQVIRVNAWRDLAEECEKKLKAGDKVLVIGRTLVNAYTTNDGKKKREVEIDASSVTIIDKAITFQYQGNIKQTSTPVVARETEKVSHSNVEEVVNNLEEIPF